MIVTDLDLPHLSVEAATLLLMDTMVVGLPQLVVIAPVVTNTVVAHHLPVMITTLVTAAIVPHRLLAPIVLLLTTLTHLLAAVTVMTTVTAHRLLVALMKIHMPPMGMSDLERGHRLLGHTGDTMNARHHQDTGDCSSL